METRIAIAHVAATHSAQDQGGSHALHHTYASQDPYDTVITADTAEGALVIANKLAASYQELTIEKDGERFSLPEFADAIASAGFGEA